MRSLGLWLVALLLVPCGLKANAGEENSAPKRAAGNQDFLALAAKIDARLAAKWAESKINPAAVADDGEFLRRASLDLVGVIPTAAESRDFLDDPDRAKRLALVDRLLDSPAYAVRAALLWRQLLLPESGDQLQFAPGGLDAWLRKKIAEEAGYDRIVREILSVKLGNPNDMAVAAVNEPSPSAFFAARNGKPEELAGDTARAFLGVRVECAQCHNHPFAKWKREEFWGFAAFFAGVAQPVDPNTGARGTREAPERREITIPGTKTVIKATHLDRTEPAWRPRAGTRDILAEWVTAPENPYFARAAVNRTWARCFGIGLIDPVDDLDVEGDPALVALLDEIAVDFQKHGYDLKYLIRALMATQAYNLSSATAAGTPTTPPLFARMPVRGLSPSQFVDSLAQATGAELGENRPKFLELFAERDVAPTESQTSILQALSLMNGKFMDAATKPETGDVIGAIAEAPYLDTSDRVEVVFLSVLTRRPKPEERTLAVEYIDKRKLPADRTRALADVFWALLNGPEFRTNH